MSMRPDGSHECDRCGTSVGNGGVTSCTVVSGLDPDRPGMVRNLHFCLDREENGENIKGCTNKVLSATNLKHYNETRESQNGNDGERSG